MKRVVTGHSTGVLEAVWMNEGISRVDLARRLGLDKSTVSHLVADLLVRGLLEEYDVAEASRQGGRKPVKLRLSKDFGLVVGVEIQSDFYRVVVVNLKGERTLSFSAEASTDAQGFVDRFRTTLEALEWRQPGSLQRCLGVGVAVSGIVDPFTGTVVESASLGMRQLCLQPSLSEGWTFPVSLENDANAACWGEVVGQQGLHQDLSSFLFCLLEFHDRPPAGPPGGSIGLGFVVNGRIHYGENFSAGEFRSLGWRPGNTFQFSLDDGEMAKLRLDPAVRSRFFRELADHVLFVSRAFNLNHVYFGGDVDLYRSELTTALEETSQRLWPAGDSPCRVRFSTHGADAVAYGAASLALTRWFRDPGLGARLAATSVFR